MKRGEIWWAELAEPLASEPGYGRPVIIVQSDAFNVSRIDTVIVVAITSNLRLKDAPGNVQLSKLKSGLNRDSVVNVSQLITIDKQSLTEIVGKIDDASQRRIDEGIRLSLSL